MWLYCISCLCVFVCTEKRGGGGGGGITGETNSDQDRRRQTGAKAEYTPTLQTFCKPQGDRVDRCVCECIAFLACLSLWRETEGERERMCVRVRPSVCSSVRERQRGWEEMRHGNRRRLMERQTDRQTDRPADRQTDELTERQERERQMENKHPCSTLLIPEKTFRYGCSVASKGENFYFIRPMCQKASLLPKIRVSREISSVDLVTNGIRVIRIIICLISSYPRKTSDIYQRA